MGLAGDLPRQQGTISPARKGWAAQRTAADVCPEPGQLSAYRCFKQIREIEVPRLLGQISHTSYLLFVMAVAEQGQVRMAALNLRPPHTTAAGAYDPHFETPSPDFLSGPWHVTHSTLPMWKKNKNVKITYTPLKAPPGALDDLVEYSPINGDKHKTIHGIDIPDATRHSAYNWKGKGWLKIASSHWEVLGYGDEDGGWMVTFFSKTMFTPAGIDVYARRKGGLSELMIERIRGEMKKVDDPVFSRMVADEIFPVKHEWR